MEQSLLWSAAGGKCWFDARLSYGASKLYICNDNVILFMYLFTVSHFEYFSIRKLKLAKFGLIITVLYMDRIKDNLRYEI